METIVGLIDLPATRSTLKKQRSAHSREFFSGDQWKESICCFNTVKQHILSLTVKKAVDIHYANSLWCYYLL
ncbi:hypothetical protein [Aneurinibacillus terranovensis]|uniref:hypothetical protein n=1 Tax=Aneurinibacillus terranovensis TaxID=278991 RepID=UPI0012DD226F|nr:hypothetical protein [Aneurinibacillus terranovensis]